MYKAHYNSVMLKGKYSQDGTIDTDRGLFYRIWMHCPRDSGAVDILPVRVPDHLMADVLRCRDDNDRIAIKGELRQCIRDGHSSLWVEAQLIMPPMDYYADNEVRMRGELCKYPIYRVTPFGCEICDMILAVRRIGGRADYVPILTWGEAARRASGYSVGDLLDIRGRFQSREYNKRLPDGSIDVRTAYELSVRSHQWTGRGKRHA